MDRQHPVEKTPRRPDEGEALAVLLGARRLAHDHQRGLRIAVADHGVGGRALERAAFEGAHGRHQLIEAGAGGGDLLRAPGGIARREQRRGRGRRRRVLRSSHGRLRRAGRHGFRHGLTGDGGGRCGGGFPVAIARRIVDRLVDAGEHVPVQQRPDRLVTAHRRHDIRRKPQAHPVARRRTLALRASCPRCAAGR